MQKMLMMMNMKIWMFSTLKGDLAKVTFTKQRREEGNSFIIMLVLLMMMNNTLIVG